MTGTIALLHSCMEGNTLVLLPFPASQLECIRFEIIWMEGMSSDRAREATCAMFVNTPTAPNYCNSLSGFSSAGLFRGRKRSIHCYCHLLSNSKKGNMNRAKVQALDVHTFLHHGMNVCEEWRFPRIAVQYSKVAKTMHWVGRARCLQRHTGKNSLGQLW